MKDSNLPSTPLLRQRVPPSLIHDLRAPLNLIIGYSEMIGDDIPKDRDSSFAFDLEKIQAAGHQLLSIISDNFYPDPDLLLFEVDNVGEDNGAETDDLQHGEDVARAGSADHYLLVVDDIEANRDVLSRRLERLGYAVVTAENGKVALEVLETRTFDLVLLDIMMPVMDGYEVLQRLKSNERLSHIPVIVISAINESGSVARCIEMGADDYLTKPFNPTLLKARVVTCIGKKLARDRETALHLQLQQNYFRLQKLETLKDDLTHMIIHDLRTPLASVIAGMGSLESLGDLNADQREMVSISLSGSSTLLGMINDLLDVEKLQSGLMELEYTDFNVSDLVSDAISQIAALAEDKHLLVTQQIPGGLARLRGDYSKLTRTLVNLLGNAVKFTPEGGQLTVEVKPILEKGSVVFCVSDTGEGIPTGAFQRIFEKFGQVESRKGGRNMSTGLGLTFCKLAVEAHGGEIGVESEPSVGSTFWFTIPTTVGKANVSLR